MRTVLKDRPDMTVYHDGDVVTKIAHTIEGQQDLRNAWRFLQALAYSGYAPRPLSLVGNELRMAYVEEELPATTEGIIETNRNAIRLIDLLRRMNILHGDLTGSNFLIHQNRPVIIDWDESRFAWESRPRKRPEPDEIHLFQALIYALKDPSRVLQRWLICRPAIEYYFGWGMFLDLGTYQGDFCGLARMSGMGAVGVDSETIFPCIEEARRQWNTISATFHQMNIMDMSLNMRPNVTMMFSVWPYLAQAYGRQQATQALRDQIAKTNVFLFETQQAGDGPGPEFLKTEDDVYELLRECSRQKPIEKLGSVVLEDRGAVRSIWAIGK